MVVDAMDLLGIAVAAFIDETSDPAGVRPAEAVPIVRSWREAADRFGGSLPVVLAVGRNSQRDRIATELLAAGVALQTICHLRAVVSPRATIGAGCYIGANVIVISDAVLGDACIVNSGACLEHHCRLGNAVHRSRRSESQDGYGTTQHCPSVLHTVARPCRDLKIEQEWYR